MVAATTTVFSFRSAGWNHANRTNRGVVHSHVMSRRTLRLGMLLATTLICVQPQMSFAGMPAPLPTGWTVEHPPEGYGGSPVAADALWQCISFFVVCLFASAGVVKVLWNALRRDVTVLPPLSYGRALSLILLWGFVFVIVLTMISGARELMTPGAWQKQGWTYRLDSPPPRENPQDERRRALEDLRIALWQHAVTHDGQFPETPEELSNPEVWSLPGWPGFHFLYVARQRPDDAGRLLAFEPEVDGDERLVLLTNGMIGTMRTSEIEQDLAGSQDP